MRHLVTDAIETLTPYVPGKPVEELERELGLTGSIKLASNENPLGASPLALEAASLALAASHIYPDGAAYRLREAIATFHATGRDEVITGNGSNELLTIAVRTFCQSGRDRAVVSRYAFAAYAIILQSHGVAIDWAPATSGLGCDLDAVAHSIGPETKLVFVANPNNPTGTYVKASALRAFLRAVPQDVVVVVDEAYHDYVKAPDYASALEMRAERERLVVCRTFSKCYGLAGLRVGYAIAPPQLVDYMNRVREPFNCSLPAQAAAIAALADTPFVERSVAINEEGRALMEAALGAMAHLGVRWIPSQTNFLLIETPIAGGTLYNDMLRQGVIVRPMGGYGLPHHLRITIGMPDEVQRCMQTLRHCLEQRQAIA